MTNPSRGPTYEDLTGPRSASGQLLAEGTRQIIALRPGEILDVTPDDDDFTAARSRLASRIRTASLQTGNRYAVRAWDGQLFVVCERSLP